jgi:hypothetical protein
MALESPERKTGDALIFDPLDTDTVSVRWLSLEAADAAHLSCWREMLDDSELQRANSLHFISDRETFITAHALTRAMLSSATGKPTGAWHYVEGEFGKPYLAPGCGADGLRFNISHTRGLVACAIAYRELGVDVESADRSTDIDVADTVFAPEEALLVNTARPSANAVSSFASGPSRRPSSRPPARDCSVRSIPFPSNLIPFGSGSIPNAPAARIPTTPKDGNLPTTVRCPMDILRSRFGTLHQGGCGWTCVRRALKRSHQHRAVWSNRLCSVLSLHRPDEVII